MTEQKMTKRQQRSFYVASVIVVMVNFYDAVFAFLHSKYFEEWEQNPLATYIYKQGGVCWVLGIKVLTLLMGMIIMIVGYKRAKPIALYGMIGLGITHAVLFLYYLISGGTFL